MELENKIIDELSAGLAAKLPEAAAEAIEETILGADNDLSTVALMLFADFVRTKGLDSIEDLTKSVLSVLEGNSDDDVQNILELSAQFDGLYFSNLVDALQNAEAEEKEQCAEACKVLGTILANVGKTVVDSIIKSLKGDLL